MKRLTILLTSLFIIGAVAAQENIGVSLRAENNQSFSVKISGRTLISSSSGYLRVTGLSESTYDITVQFTAEKDNEQQFRFAVTKADTSFLLKRNSDQSIVLQVLQPNPAFNKPPPPRTGGDVVQVRRTDNFAMMMAAVVNDTSVLYTSISKAEPVPDARKSDEKPFLVKNEIRGTAVVKPVLADSGKADIAKNIETTNPESLVPDSARRETQTVSQQTPAQKSLMDSAVLVTVKESSAQKTARKPEVSLDTLTNAIGAPIKDSSLSKSETAKSTEMQVPAEEASRPIVKKDTATELATQKPVNARPVDSAIAKPSTEVKPPEPVWRPRVTDTASKKQSTNPPLLDGNTRIYQLGIVKAAERKDEKAVQLVFIDRAGPAQADTIYLSIQVEASVPMEPVMTPGRKTDGPVSSTRKDTPTSVSKPNTESPVQKDTTKKAYTPEPVWRPLEKKNTAMVNSDCSSFATEYDLDRLRVKMIAENNADDRINAARKIFKTKCFSVRQVRALSELFINDDGKYKFLDAAYPYVSDTDQFHTLVDLLKDSYYVNRFNAMIRK